MFTINRFGKHHNQKGSIRTNNMSESCSWWRHWGVTSKCQGRLESRTSDTKFNTVSSLPHSHHTEKSSTYFVYAFTLSYFALDVSNGSVIKLEFKPHKKVQKPWELQGRHAGYISNLQCRLYQAATPPNISGSHCQRPKSD